jgi:hypothetical protein
MYLVSLHFAIHNKTIYNYYRWFNVNHVHGTIMPRQSSIDAPSSNNVIHAASNGSHKTVRNKDARAASNRRRVRVSYGEMARHWSIEEDDDMTGSE